MNRNGWAAFAIAALGAANSGALAADAPARPVAVAEAPSPTAEAFKPGLYAHAGVAGILLSESARISAGGAHMPGASISIDPQATFALEAGYFVTPNVAFSLTGGVPPLAQVEASGSIEGYGRIGSTTYGPVALTAHYHFMNFGRFQPYVGVGPAFLLVFNMKDGLMSEFKVRNNIGVAFQVGADIMLTDHWGVFFDVKKVVLRTEAVGFLGPAPVRADVTLDPTVLHAGVTYRF